MNHFTIVLILLGVLFFCLVMNVFYYTNNTGIHYLIDINNIPDKLVNDNKRLIEITEKCINNCKLNVLNHSKHEFSPHGLTVLYMLSESHFSMHTWPEKNLIRIDLFSCSNMNVYTQGVEYLKNEFKDCDIIVRKIMR
jgi:S-adenosylmethionine decarboxylase proenzyme